MTIWVNLLNVYSADLQFNVDIHLGKTPLDKQQKWEIIKNV